MQYSGTSSCTAWCGKHTSWRAATCGAYNIVNMLFLIMQDVGRRRYVCCVLGKSIPLALQHWCVTTGASNDLAIPLTPSRIQVGLHSKQCTGKTHGSTFSSYPKRELRSGFHSKISTQINRTRAICVLQVSYMAHELVETITDAVVDWGWLDAVDGQENRRYIFLGPLRY